MFTLWGAFQLALKVELVSEEVQKRILDMELRAEASDARARQRHRSDEERRRQQGEEEDDEDEDDSSSDDDDDEDAQQAAAQQVGRGDAPPPVPRQAARVDGAGGKGAGGKGASTEGGEVSRAAPRQVDHRTRK